MQDGREDLFLAAFARQRESWSQDVYLVLQRGEALLRLDRLSEAEAAFHAAMQRPDTTPEQKAFAESRLGWIDREWETIQKGRAALSRARLAIGGGLALLAAASIVTWVLVRRQRLGHE